LRLDGVAEPHEPHWHRHWGKRGARINTISPEISVTRFAFQACSFSRSLEDPPETQRSPLCNPEHPNGCCYGP